MFLKLIHLSLQNYKTKTYMRKRLTTKEVDQRLRLLKQQLTLSVLYEANFIENIGKRGLENMRNDILDEINFLRKNYEL